MRKALLLLISIFFVMILAACSDEPSVAQKNATIDIKTTIEQYSLGHIEENVKMASVTSKELIITKDNDEHEIYALPEDEFYVSIAPYENVTHPCADHSLTTCQGEMVEKEFDVLIKDTDGNIIVDKSMDTLQNGFIDFWLPRDKEYQVIVKHNGKTAESEISTYQGDNTCITTLHLA